MISLLLMLSCAAKTTIVGVVDVIDNGVCVIQLSDETTVIVDSELCKSFKEGDKIYTSRRRK